MQISAKEEIMRDTRKGILGLSVGLTLALFVGTVDAQQGDIRAAIEAGNTKFVSALGRGIGRDLAALYTTDAQLFPTSSDIVSGRQAIEEFWQGVIDSGVKDATLTTLEVEAHDDTAYEVGKYSMKGEDGEVLDTGKYLVIWKREDGQWKLHRDIWNTSMPAPGQ